MHWLNAGCHGNAQRNSLLGGTIHVEFGKHLVVGILVAPCLYCNVSQDLVTDSEVCHPNVVVNRHMECMHCHTVKLFHSKNIGFGTIFLHYHYFLIAYKNHDSKIFNILGIQHKNQMRGQEADDTRRREKN